MKNFLLITAILTGFVVSSLPRVADAQSDTANAVEFELIVRQQPLLVDRHFEITRDTLPVVRGHESQAFLANMSLTLGVEQFDSSTVTFTCHLTTVGSSPYHFGERYRIELNLPARIENIPAKNGATYQLLISPRRLTYLDTSGCHYDFRIPAQYEMQPSASFDIYYVNNSLADFHWNNIKNYLEYDFSRFRNTFDLDATGKINFFIYPCPSWNIHWDSRFGYALDPTRSNVRTIHSHHFSSVDVMLANMVRLLKLWGYAPPFLVEGMAAFFDFTPYRIKKMKAEDKIPPLDSLLTTAGYYAADPIAAEVTAASFVKFLIDSYGRQSFRELYLRSDDLVLRRNLEEIYGYPIDSLEKLWLNYVDTTTLNRYWFDHFAARAGALFQTDRQLEYITRMLDYDATAADSIDTRKKLGIFYYQTGRYYDAIEKYRWLIANDSSTVMYWQTLANLYLISGEYEKSEAALDSVLAIDTAFATAGLLQARIAAIRGDTARAVRIAEAAYPLETTGAGKIEFLLFLGAMYGARGSHYDSAMAEQSYSDALFWTTDMMPRAADDPAFNMRAGLAALGLKKYDEAAAYLELAHFTERRVYFLGRTTMHLGMLHDLLGDRARAVEYYQEALTLPLGTHHRELCERYIEKPYRN